MELEFRNYPEHLIAGYDQWCEDLFNKIKFNQIQIQTLEKLRDTLLPKLMSGEVRVDL
jgi:type I restriction enzyme S subunit